MTQEEIILFNEKCAKFLGCTFTIETLFENDKDRETVFYKSFSKPPWWNDSSNHRYGFLSYQRTDYMLYHSDWNWIMQLVEAIEKLETPNKFSTMFSVIIGYDYCQIKLHPQVALAFEEIDNSFGDDIEIVSDISKKDAVIQAFDKFFDWYEKQNK